MYSGLSVNCPKFCLPGTILSKCFSEWGTQTSCIRTEEGGLIKYSFPHNRITGEGPGNMYFKVNPAMVTFRNTDLQYKLKN